MDFMRISPRHSRRFQRGDGGRSVEVSPWVLEVPAEWLIFEIEEADVRNHSNLSSEVSFRGESFICEVKFAL